MLHMTTLYAHVYHMHSYMGILPGKHILQCEIMSTLRAS